MNEELKVVITAEISKLKKNLEDAKKKVSDFAKKGKDNLKKFNDSLQKVGDVSKKALSKLGKTLAGAATALLALAGSTNEYRTEQAKLTTAFETAGASADTAKQTYNDLYRVLGDSGVAVEAAGHLAQLTTNEQELSEWTTICQGVYATFGDSIPIEGLTEAANETAKVGEITGSLADALNWAGVSEEEFNAKLAACNTEAEREALIRETLNGIYSGAAANYEANAAALLAHNEAQSRLNDSMALLGEAVSPVLTVFMNFAATLAEQLAPIISEFVETYLPTLEETLNNVATAIGGVFTWISDNWELVSTLGTIILSVAAAFTVLSTVASVVGGAFTFLSNPMNIIIVLIGAMVAGIVYCIQNWDAIKAKVGEVVGNIKNWVSDMVAKVGEWFGNMKEKMETAINSAKEAVSNKFNEIKTNITDKVNSIKETVSTKFTEIKDGMKEKIDAAKTAITTTITNIVDTFRDKFNSAKETVLGIFDGIKSGISEKFEAAKSVVSGAIDKIKGFLNFDWSLPKLKLPHLTVSGKLDLFRIPPSIPKVSVSWYAKGGVFDSPTLFNYGNGALGGLGEAGAEAVVPLEKNLGWLDKLATMLNDRMGGNTPIVLTVDGKVFAETTIDTINNHTRQTGKLAINLI